MENAVRDSIEFTPIMKKAMKPMDSWHVTRREDTYSIMYISHIGFIAISVYSVSDHTPR